MLRCSLMFKAVAVYNIRRVKLTGIHGIIQHVLHIEYGGSPVQLPYHRLIRGPAIYLAMIGAARHAPPTAVTTALLNGRWRACGGASCTP